MDWGPSGTKRRSAEPEFTLHRVGQEMPELHEESLVETKIGAQLADLLGGGVLAQQKNHRIAHVLKQHERDQRNADHDDHGLRQAPKYECKHRGYT